jgi:hypothetical protein
MSSIVFILLIIYGILAIGCMAGTVIFIIYNTQKYCRGYYETMVFMDEMLENHKENIIDAHKKFNLSMYEINKKIFSINLNIDDFQEKSISITEEEPFIEKILDKNDKTIRKDDE